MIRFIQSLRWLVLVGMLVLSLAHPSRANAQVTVAFFEMVDAQGRLIQYEVGSRFAHVALLVGDHWLHAYPYYGVQIVPDFSGIAYHSVVFLHHPEYPMPTWSEIESQFHKRFSLVTTWEDPDNTYCSKMIGQLLRLEPEPMIFDAPMWRELPESTYRQLLRFEGLLGLSPDDVFRRLIERGFR